MNGRVAELVFFVGCPHVVQARSNLGEALKQAGFEPIWDERVIESAGGESEYPSPTILVGGQDVTPVAPNNTGASACRLQGAPAVDVIVRALESTRLG
jgi:hypothetical protein